MSVNSLESSIEISYKKVGDGHPLRLWRAVTEIEAGIDEVSVVFIYLAKFDIRSVCHTGTVYKLKKLQNVNILLLFSIKSQNIAPLYYKMSILLRTKSQYIRAFSPKSSLTF